MVSKVSLEAIKTWLVEGVDEPETFVDLRWEVLDEYRDSDGRLISLRVTHPRIPVNLVVLDMEVGETKLPCIRLVVETGIETIDLEPRLKTKLYRLLLEGSKMPMAKFYLFGDSDEIGIAADLDKELLTKEEFEEALAGVLLGYMMLMETSGLAELLSISEAQVLYTLVSNWYSRGVKRAEALERLVRAGLDKEIAELIVGKVYSSSGTLTYM